MKFSICSIFVVGALSHHAFAQPAPAPAPASDGSGKDATADAAGVPAAPLKASADDIDLSSLGLDPGSAAFDDKLNIYGYADFSYRGEYAGSHKDVLPDAHGFTVGNLNVYLAKNLTQKARMLVEVQYTFLPNASLDAANNTVDTNVRDPANDLILTRWGGIVIQRAYLEYDLTEYLTIRAGHWLTPYGIWNTDHGSPTIITVTRPYIIDAGMFPEHQTGVDLLGSQRVSDFKVSYHVTVSNGRSETEAQIDHDNKLAFGGRLELDTPWGLRVGGSYYRGRYTGNPSTTPGVTTLTYREESYSGDAQFNYEGLHLQGEVATHNSHYADVATAAAATGGAATSPDTSDTGYYVLGGYRFEEVWNVMPFAYYQYYKQADHSVFAEVTLWAAGLNFRPTASMVFKLQFQHASLDGPGYLGGGTLQSKYYAQAAWVF